MAPKPDWTAPVTLGKSGLRVGRLGIGSSYGAPEAAILEAFDRGQNYFYWGSLRRGGMGRAIRALGKSRRRELVVAIQSYSRSAWLLERSLLTALRRLKIEEADVLILGLWNKSVAERVLERALALQRRGLVRHLAISAHLRSAFATHLDCGAFDILQVRYNAAHPGAEEDVFPLLPEDGGPGITTYTATRWGHLLRPQRMPQGERTPTASDCYRFALSHPAVHVCMTGPANVEEMRHALTALERGPLDEAEMAWLRRVGSFVRDHSRPRFR
jgi:aryl-alcohol dehydrogenase-like predicted oxidoreductase